MRAQMWKFDTVLVDLEDRDVTVRIVHARSMVSIAVEFRMMDAAMDTSVQELKRRAECLARERLLEVASFLDER